MDAQDMLWGEISRKQLIWYGHVERMDPTRLPKIMIHWKPEGRKKRGRPRRTKLGPGGTPSVFLIFYVFLKEYFISLIT